MTHDYSDTKTEEILRKTSQSAGFNGWADFKLIAAGNGQVELLLHVRPDMTQHHGFVHGGIIGAMADTACSWAAASAAGDVVTSTYTIQFLAPAKGDHLRIKAAVIKQGKRQVSAESKVYAESENASPKLVAVALASIAIVGGKS